MSSSLKTSGPLFNGQAKAAVVRYLQEAEELVAQAGVNLVRQRLGQVLKNPTGYYTSHVQTDRATADVAVTDGGVVYGPWLEGTGSRNQSTRFKGYATFRKTTRELQGLAGPIANQALGRHIGGMQ